MFSVMGLPIPLDQLLSQFGSSVSIANADHRALEARSLATGWPEFDALLPDGGLPAGVVEITANRALGGATLTALTAVRAAHANDAAAWCAWIDPWGTLHGPGVAMAGVDLDRLFVVRPPLGALAKIAVKIARSQAFQVVVVDLDPMGVTVDPRPAYEPTRRPKNGERSPRARSGEQASRESVVELLVRKLALLAHEGGMTILLLSNGSFRRSSPLPVALRLELTRSLTGLDVRIAKDRHGRIGLAKTIPLASRPRVQWAV